MKKYFAVLVGGASAFLLPIFAFAHEVYVLPKEEVANAMSKTDYNVFSALQNPENIRQMIGITIAVSIAFFLNFLFRHSTWGDKNRRMWEKLSFLAPHCVRIAVAVALFYSAYSWSFFGPELSLHDFPHAEILRAIMFVLSGMFFFGFLAEVAGIVALIVFAYGLYVYHAYMLTYANYLGEFIVFALFGLRSFSIDKIWRGPGVKKFWEKHSGTIIRVFYGVSLAYAAIYVKFLHPQLTLDVVNYYHLTQFHLLFPSDPMLVVLGAGLAELSIAMFIIFGFEMRFTVLISLFYLTLSLLFFRESVWPHLMLYGISFSILFDKETFTIDNLVDRFFHIGRRIKSQ